MADEVTIQETLTIRKYSGEIPLIDYQSRPNTFRMDMIGTFGEAPGAVPCTTEGTDIDLSNFVEPGLCWLMNTDDTNWVEYGLYDPETNRFYAWGELGPGEFARHFFSRNFRSEYFPASGTGTSAETNRFRIRADGDTCNVRVHVFER